MVEKIGKNQPIANQRSSSKKWQGAFESPFSHGTERCELNSLEEWNLIVSLKRTDARDRGHTSLLLTLTKREWWVREGEKGDTKTGIFGMPSGWAVGRRVRHSMQERPESVKKWCSNYQIFRNYWET